MANVELGVESDDSVFRFNGETAIRLGVLRQSRSNTDDLGRRAREDRATGRKKHAPAKEAVRDGANQVFFAVIPTSATQIAVFLPL